MVALFEKMMVPCQRVNKLLVSDGEGGWETTWTDGAEFEAAIHRESGVNERIAEKMGTTDQYTVTTSKGFYLAFHDVFRRLSDGKVFRVTADSADRVTPDAATFAFRRVMAEEWELES